MNRICETLTCALADIQALEYFQTGSKVGKTTRTCKSTSGRFDVGVSHDRWHTDCHDDCLFQLHSLESATSMSSLCVTCCLCVMGIECSKIVLNECW